MVKMENQGKIYRMGTSWKEVCVEKKIRWKCNVWKCCLHGVRKRKFKVRIVSENLQLIGTVNIGERGITV